MRDRDCQQTNMLNRPPCLLTAMHCRLTQVCFMRPGPPNLRMSLQKVHSPHSERVQGSHFLQRVRRRRIVDELPEAPLAALGFPLPDPYPFKRCLCFCQNRSKRAIAVSFSSSWYVGNEHTRELIGAHNMSHKYTVNWRLKYVTQSSVQFKMVSMRSTHQGVEWRSKYVTQIQRSVQFKLVSVESTHKKVN